MTWFLRFAFWFAVGTMVSGASITLYLLSAVRRMELFPSFTGAVVVPALLLAVMIRCFAWALARKKQQKGMETFFIAEPARSLVKGR